MNFYKPNKPLINCLLLTIMATSASVATAETYVIHKDVSGKQAGSYFEYKDRYFVVGETAFDGWWSMTDKLVDGDIIYFGPHATGAITINKNNLTLLGSNAYCDQWSGQRTNPESSFTDKVTIANGVSGLTINGFTFTGDGCVRNETSGRGSTALHDISLLYNKIENTTLPNGPYQAIFYLGNAHRPNSTVDNQKDPSLWAANERYENVTIAHNAFIGKNAPNQPACIQVAGSYGTLNIVDNHFEYGGTSINLFNLSGDFNIKHNRFEHVGKGLLASGSATGEFCVRLYYIGARTGDKPVNGYIRHNIFDDCQGQSGMFALIRFYSGDANETIYKPHNTELYINHNVFKNKTSHQGTSNNYVFYANKGTCTDGAHVDWRFNRFDNSELQFAWVQPRWHNTPGRFYASSSEIFEHSTANSETEGTGTLIDYYGAKTAPDGTYFGGQWVTGNRLKSNTFAATTVVQSFDRDDVTGDFYFIQVQNGTYGSGGNGGGPYTSEKPVVVTRSYKTSSGYNETKMYLDWAGHGSNIGVLNVNGTCYMFVGGCQSSAKATAPQKVAIVPFVAGATVDIRQTSFSYGGKTYAIKHINRSMSSAYSHPYASVDQDNNLYVERSRSSAGDYFTIYDLTDVFNNPSTARPIRQLFIKAGTGKITGSSRAFFNNADNGFKTWSDQGFTVSGDYVYAYEGNGNEGYSGTPTPTDGFGILIINVANWRTGQFIYRKAILKTKVYGSTDQGPYKMIPGEPEAIKVHRDDSGRACLLIGVVEGASGKRKYNVFAYRQKRVAGQGRDLTTELQPVSNMSPDQSSMDFVSPVASTSASISVDVNGEVRDVNASIVGDDGQFFAVSKTAGDVYSDTHQYNVTFAPGNHKATYAAYLKLSTPGCSDIMVPLKGTFSGQLSGVEDVLVDRQARREIVGYYDLMGRRLDHPSGMTVIRYSDGHASKTIAR